MKRFFITIFILFTSGVTYAEETSSVVDNFPGIEIPVFEPNYNLERVFNRPKYTKSLNYYVKIRHPAANVIRFYHTEYKKMGWKKYEADSSKEWFTFPTSSVKGSPLSSQFLSFFTSSKHKLKVMVALRYGQEDEHWNDLHVICQIMPNVDSTKLLQFVKNSLSSEHELDVKFWDLIETLETPESLLDDSVFNRIITKNQDLSDLLLKYRQLMADQTKQNEEIISSFKK